MNREKAKKLLPMIEAFANGETIEILNAYGEWVPVNCVQFTLSPEKYRIKPNSLEKQSEAENEPN